MTLVKAIIVSFMYLLYGLFVSSHKIFSPQGSKRNLNKNKNHKSRYLQVYHIFAGEKQLFL